MNCTICPVSCGKDRLRSPGYCGEKSLRIAKYGLHFYEEPPISFRGGSGAIFFCGCALKCVFCQNYELSRSLRGKEITPTELARIFKELEAMGAENINLVNPAHFVPQIIEAFQIYRPQVPVVYNTHSYEKVETLQKIDPYVDIYLPDLKFCSAELSKRYTGKSNYFEIAKKAVAFMQKKPLRMSEEGKMLSGVIVRHLVLPMCVSDSRTVLSYLKEALPQEAYVSVMAQYTPFGEIDAYPELKRPITAREYRAVCEHLKGLAFPRLFLQERTASGEEYIPSWDY